MTPTNTTTPGDSLPITRSLTVAYASSLIVALLMAAVSVAGLLYRSDIYPSEELAQTFVANDVVNLFIGVPILLVSMYFARRGKLIGLLFWPGALFFIVYNTIVYLFAMPFNWAFLSYLALLALSLYTMIGLVASIDGKAVQQRLSGNVPERLAGGVLTGLGTLFLLRTLGELANAIVNQTAIPRTEVALLVADFLMIPAWVVGGVLLWRHQEQGYVGGTGLLFQGSMLFIGLIVFLLLAPIMTGAPFVLVDVIVVFILGLICFIPFGLFVRGVARA
ncbi:MAG: hypothetical protein U9R25_03575 [Chloroflexota bacterium]|nr:hypothetical protein [Chloroflexota bacterium]